MLKKILSVAIIAIAVVGCSEDEESVVPPNTIANVVENNPAFSRLRQALVRTNLLETVRTASNITVFAPDNTAFATAGIDSVAIANLPIAAVANILTYHVVPANVTSTQVPASDSVSTLNRNVIFASRNANGVFVNGISVKQADVNASNGTVHVISNVLIPPTVSIADIAAGDTSFTILVAAVQRAGLLSAIQGRGKFTVFAPTNAAFRAAGFANPAAVQAADQATVTAVVRFHLIGTNVFASDLVNNATAASLQGNLTIRTSPSAGVRVAASNNPFSNVTTANVLATNGVVHIIDRVILP